MDTIEFFYSFFLVVGMLLLILSFISWVRVRRLLKSGKRMDAIVVKLERVESVEGLAFKPVFEYFDKKINRKKLYRSPYMSNPAPFKLGEKTTLIRNPEDPSDVQEITFWSLFIVPVFLVVFGASFILIALFLT